MFYPKQHATWECDDIASNSDTIHHKMNVFLRMWCFWVSVHPYLSLSSSQLVQLRFLPYFWPTNGGEPDPCSCTFAWCIDSHSHSLSPSLSLFLFLSYAQTTSFLISQIKTYRKLNCRPIWSDAICTCIYIRYLCFHILFCFWSHQFFAQCINWHQHRCHVDRYLIIQKILSQKETCLANRTESIITVKEDKTVLRKHRLKITFPPWRKLTCSHFIIL